MNIIQVPIQSITPYARNPRKNAGAVAQVKASLKEYGWRQPIVVDAERVILAGHTRYQAALELGMTDVPVHVAEGLTPAQAKAYRIMDNRSHEQAELDMDLLALEMEDLKGMEFDLELTGFGEDELFLNRSNGVPESSAKEINPDDYELNTKCPRCGFEFDEKT